MIDTNEQLAATVNALIDGWCQRRALAPLRVVLPAWPPESSLPTDWWRLRDGLKHVRLNLYESLIGDETVRLAEAIEYLDRMFRLE